MPSPPRLDRASVILALEFFCRPVVSAVATGRLHAAGAASLRALGAVLRFSGSVRGVFAGAPHRIIEPTFTGEPS